MARRLSTRRRVLWLLLSISSPLATADTLVLLQPDIEQHRIDPYTSDGLPRQLLAEIPTGYRATESGALVSYSPSTLEYGVAQTQNIFFCPPPGRRLTRCQITRTPPATSSSVGDGAIVFPDLPDGSAACCLVDEQVSAGSSDDFVDPVKACVIAQYDDGTVERHDCYEYTVTGAPAPPPDPPPIDTAELAANAQAATGGTNAAGAQTYVDSQPDNDAGDRAITNYVVSERARWTGVADHHCAKDPAAVACTIASQARDNYTELLVTGNWCLSGKNAAACPVANCLVSGIAAWGSAQPAGSYPAGWTLPPVVRDAC